MRIALVAHNGKKDDMVALATEFAPQLRQHTLMATGTTESPRVLRRLQTLRRWSHEQEIKSFFTRNARTRCLRGARSHKVTPRAHCVLHSCSVDAALQKQASLGIAGTQDLHISLGTPTQEGLQSQTPKRLQLGRGVPNIHRYRLRARLHPRHKPAQRTRTSRFNPVVSRD